jgi:small nuclear ribonucleoprotein (snRNP)-like protein
LRFIQPAELDVPVVVELENAVMIRGRVVEADKTTPVVDQTVTARMRQSGELAKARTNAQGRFEIPVLPGVPYALRVRAPQGGARHESTAPSQTDEKAEVVLILSAWASVSGHVRTEEGEPVEGMTVYSMVADTNLNSSSSEVSAQTNKEGYYYLENVSAGEISVSVSTGQSAKWTPPAAVPLKLEPGEYRRGVDFVLTAGFMAEGIVVDEEGNPIDGANININGTSTVTGIPYHANAMSGEDGRFRIGPIPDDESSCHLYAHKPGYETLYMQRAVPSTSMRLMLKRESHYTIELTAIPPAGAAPVTRLRYRWLMGPDDYVAANIGNCPVMTTTTGDPIARVKGPAANYRIDVMAVDDALSPLGLVGTAFVKVEANQPIEEPIRVEVNLQPARRISGRVVAAQGSKPMPGATVRQAPRNNYYSPSYGTSPNDPVLFHPRPVVTDAAGNFTLTGVMPGRLRLEALLDGPNPRATETVEVPADRDLTDIVLTIGDGSVIFGRVIGPDGQPAVGANLMHSSRAVDGSFRTEEVPVPVAADGTYRLEGLANATHQLRAQFGRVFEHRTQEINEKGEYQVDFDLSGRVLLSGTITVGDRPWNNNGPNLYFSSPQGTSRSTSLSNLGGGRYEAWVEPGEFQLEMYIQGERRPHKVESFAVAAEPREQERNFTLDLVPVDIVLVFPNDEDFTPGKVTLTNLDRETPGGPPQPGQDMTSESMRLPLQMPGRYRATFASTDGKWQGSSEEVSIGRGLENIIVINLEPPAERHQIGRWAPENFPTPGERSTIEVDITRLMTRGGPLEIAFEYKSGSDGLAIHRVELLCGGGIIAVDEHEGWSGFSRRDHLFRLDAGELRPGLSYSIRATVSAGTGNSNGEIWLQR